MAQPVTGLLVRNRQAIIDWAVTTILFLVVTILLTFIFVRPWSPAFLSTLPWMILIGLVVSGFTAYIMTPFVLDRTAKDLDPQSSAAIKPLFREISTKAGLRIIPKLVVVQDESMNAMAYCSILGPRIAITSGLLEYYCKGSMTQDEFFSILTHEVGHVKEMHMFREAFVLSWVSIFVLIGGLLWRIGKSKAVLVLTYGLGLILLLIGGFFRVLAKIVSIITFRFSRHLELRADTFSSSHYGRPSSLASGLKKIETGNEEIFKSQIEKEVRQLPGYADWQFKPLNESWIDKLFDTHPSVEARAKNLAQITAVSTPIVWPSVAPPPPPPPYSQPPSLTPPPPYSQPPPPPYSQPPAAYNQPPSGTATAVGRSYKFCTKCGTKIPGTAEFCPTCGKRQV
jgi:Zn-dependent protease with chaperone function/ribosomal protein L40E